MAEIVASPDLAAVTATDPMKALGLSAGAVPAVVVAHPDDETLGFGILLQRLPAVSILHVTDGAPADMADAGRLGFASCAEYAAVRRRELDAALALADIPPDGTCRMDYTDQEAAFDMARSLAVWSTGCANAASRTSSPTPPREAIPIMTPPLSACAPPPGCCGTAAISHRLSSRRRSIGCATASRRIRSLPLLPRRAPSTCGQVGPKSRSSGVCWGFHLALEACHAADMDLLIDGTVFPYEAHERYFHNEVAPRLDRRRRFLGPLGFDRKRRLLAAARCALVPSLVAETSSLSAMEALPAERRWLRSPTALCPTSWSTAAQTSSSAISRRWARRSRRPASSIRKPVGQPPATVSRWPAPSSATSPNIAASRLMRKLRRPSADRPARLRCTPQLPGFRNDAFACCSGHLIGSRRRVHQRAARNPP